MTAGAKKNTRSTLRALMAEFTPSASRSPIRFWMTVMDTAISRVCQIACMALGSSHISTKLPIVGDVVGRIGEATSEGARNARFSNT